VGAAVENKKFQDRKTNKVIFLMYVQILVRINIRSWFTDKEWESTCLYRHIQTSLLMQADT